MGPSPTDNRNDEDAGGVPGKARLLLHACCAPCSSSVVEQLQRQFDITILFDNANIHPRREYEQRRDELQRWCRDLDIALQVPAYEPALWLAAVHGLERQPEKGRRCTRCYRLRLERTAQQAARQGFDVFTTVLSISPHKRADKINRLGAAIARRYGLVFFAANFKKGGGFQRSLELSRRYGFYRQNYCGCTFSRQQSAARRAAREKAGSPTHG
ncbi:MAG: epoxyqueuosine reductase QueH [Desulfuromonadaceae bacterium]|nr:epoxyqueuosine reductase QueH [Desulfuromonadaceae bacterium]